MALDTWVLQPGWTFLGEYEDEDYLDKMEAVVREWEEIKGERFPEAILHQMLVGLKEQEHLQKN